MPRNKLLPALTSTFKDWLKDQKRTSWLYCPICKHDLNGDNNSFLHEKDNHWFYKCSNCGCKSKWSLSFLTPICIAWQRVNGSMKPKEFSLDSAPNQETTKQ
jgi:hypothetical protein